MFPFSQKPLCLRLLVLLAVTTLTACNPSESSSGNNDNGNGDGGGDNDDNGNLVELDHGVGFARVMDPDPGQIALRGYGTGQIPETTRLSVQVLDNDLNPVTGHEVSFDITDDTGSPVLTRNSATTGGDGSASTILRSGTVQGTTQVEITMDLLDSSGTLIEQDVHVATTQPVSMHTAAPVTDGVSLSADVFNPEGYDFNGIPVQITVHLGDLHRNPVADGTQVNFLASTGMVDPVCTTNSGSCTIEWRSAHPKGDGRVDILARTNGNDAFVDTNGNSRFDPGESYEPQGEPYVDTEGTGQFNPGDFFWDLSGTGDYTPADPGANYKGIGCTEAALDQGHCAERAVVFGNIVLVASGSALRLDPEPTDVNVGDVVTYQMVDQNDNVPPAGSSLSVSCTDASATALDAEVPDRPGDLFGPWPVVVNYGDDPGACTLEVQSPNGLPQRYTVSVN